MALTPQQLFRLRDLALAGKTDPAIASALGISTNTVRNRRRRLGIASPNARPGCTRKGYGVRPGAPCSWHTDVPPGPEKVELLALRVAAGEQLWHEDDRTAFDAT